MKPQVFVFMGPSGSGKGTQADLLRKYLEGRDERKVLYLETGQAFREFTKTDTRTADMLKDTISEGGLVPVFLPVWVWTDFLVKNYTGEEHIIFDGLARREIEAPILDSAMEFYGVEHINIIYINTSDEWSTERLTERGRSDDKLEEIRKRLSWFKDNTLKAVDYFRNYEKGHFHEINGEQTIEEVHNEILQKLGFK